MKIFDHEILEAAFWADLALLKSRFMNMESIPRTPPSVSGIEMFLSTTGMTFGSASKESLWNIDAFRDV
jgi:hypothetical protein